MSTAFPVVLKQTQQSRGLELVPTDCLLGACSGRQSVGYRFSLLTLLFSGVVAHNLTHGFRGCLALLQIFAKDR